jgi:REP element-mobilizing transposase RayT
MGKLPVRRNSNRIQQHDYSTSGYYFVTICVENRQQIFGTIENHKLILNDAGNMVNSVLKTIPQHYQGIFIDEYIVMPNHIHGIIIIKNIVGVDPRVDPIQNNISTGNRKINHNGRLLISV